MAWLYSGDGSSIAKMGFLRGEGRNDLGGGGLNYNPSPYRSHNVNGRMRVEPDNGWKGWDRAPRAGLKATMKHALRGRRSTGWRTTGVPRTMTRLVA